MNRIVDATHKERKMVFETAAAKLKIPVDMIEKDFWVCWILKKIFANPNLAKILRFKGGTSLSKVFHLIKRFSEDIDLILDWRCVTSENPLEKRSNSKQDLFNKDIQNISGEAKYIKQTISTDATAPMELLRL
jgi:predicted nucleotidyltransferase component of viral defense system